MKFTFQLIICITYDLKYFWLHTQYFFDNQKVLWIPKLFNTNSFLTSDLWNTSRGLDIDCYKSFSEMFPILWKYQLDMKIGLIFSTSRDLYIFTWTEFIWIFSWTGMGLNIGIFCHQHHFTTRNFWIWKFHCIYK